MANRFTTLEEFCGSGGCSDWERRAWEFADLVAQTARAAIQGENYLIRSGFESERTTDGLLDLTATFYGWSGCNSDHRVVVKMTGYDAGSEGWKIAELSIQYRDRSCQQSEGAQLTIQLGEAALTLTLGKSGWTGTLQGDFLRMAVVHFGLLDRHGFDVATAVTGEILTIRYGATTDNNDRRLKKAKIASGEPEQLSPEETIEERLPYNSIAQMRSASHVASLAVNSDWARHREAQARVATAT